MDLSSAAAWQPPDSWQKLTVIDSHAGGEPFRIVVDGLPDIPGETVLERRRYAERSLDHLRRGLMWEPRGHADMYGGWLGAPVADDSDLSVLFLHNEGFSTMCGHGIIALTKVALDTGIVAMNESDEATIGIDTPAGQILATAVLRSGAVASVHFRNVASFVDSLDNHVSVEGLGDVTYDLAFGGAFYAYVDALSLGLTWPPFDTAQLVDAGRSIKQAIIESRVITHPRELDLAFLYGVIFTGPASSDGYTFRNVCVFADGEVDRSPTGTGVSGHIAIQDARGAMSPGDQIVVESIVGSSFSGTLLERTSIGDMPAVIPGISGTARITGRAEFWFDPDDELSPGFLLR